MVLGVWDDGGHLSVWPNMRFPVANLKPSLEMENEEKIRLEARRRLEEQLKQYRVQRHKERVSEWSGVPHVSSASFSIV